MGAGRGRGSRARAPKKKNLARAPRARAPPAALFSRNLPLIRRWACALTHAPLFTQNSTCTPGSLTPSRRAPAVLQWPSARAVLITAACAKNATSGALAGDAPCEGALTSSTTVPAYALPPRWEPATFVTPACGLSLTLPFPGLAGEPSVPGGDGGYEIPLLPPTTLTCESIAALKNLGPGGWVGKGRKNKVGKGCALQGPLVDPQEAISRALAKLEEAKAVLGLA